MSGISALGSPMPVSEIESVLAWVDTFKLSRQTKKINRDFSDAVLLAEIMCVHYPKLVEMHNYPPRNSHSLKLNNWMTLNRKVLKKLKLNLCCNTMEQLANSVPGIIERVLVMVRDRIRRDEELNKTAAKDAEQNMSSGGSYYEACGEDENVLVVPVKARVNGTLETIQQKVVSYDTFLAIKEELKDAKDVTDLLKQKVDHLDNLLKLKDERIEELQRQLDRKLSRRNLKEGEPTQNATSITSSLPFDLPHLTTVDAAMSVTKISTTKCVDGKTSAINLYEPLNKAESIDKESIDKFIGKPSITSVSEDLRCDLDRIKSDVFKEAEVMHEFHDVEEFKDSEQDGLVTIEDSIQKEIFNIMNPGLESSNILVE